MPQDSTYPIGAPFWIETLQSDVPAAAEYYRQLFDWTVDGAVGEGSALAGTDHDGVAGDGESGDVLGARLDGKQVAGIRQAPDGVPAAWLIHIRVADVDATLTTAEALGGSCLLPALGHRSSRSRPPRARVAVLADPSGIAFCISDAAAGAGAESIAEVGAWSTASLHAPDARVAQDFYGGLFGWDLHEVADAPFSRWSLHERTVGLLSDTEDAPPHWAVTIAIDDADTTAALVESLGGAFIAEPFDTESHRNTVIADPAGAVLSCSARNG